MCTFGRPMRSSSSSMPSTRASTDGPTSESSAWSAGVPMQGRHDHFVVVPDRAGTGDQARQVAPIPCRNSRGCPVPARWMGVSSTRTLQHAACRCRAERAWRAATAPAASSAVAATVAVRRGSFAIYLSGSGSGCQHGFEDLATVLGRHRLVDLRQGIVVISLSKGNLP